MIELPEHELRALFTQRAATVTDEGAAKVTARLRLRRRRPLIGVGAAGVAAGSVAVSLVLTAGSPAFAGWSPTPTPASVAAASSAAANCETVAARTAVSLNQTASSGQVVFPTNASDWSPIVTDVRGPYVFAALRATDGTTPVGAFCLDATDGSTEIVLSGGQSQGGSATVGSEGTIGASGGEGNTTVHNQGTTTQGSPGTGPNSVVHSVGSTFSMAALLSTTPPPATVATEPIVLAGEDDATYVLGLAGSSVTGVALTLSDGTVVTATVSNGYYAAWWPGTVTPTSLAVTTTNGTTTTTTTTPLN